jgi:hypothetical protein
MTTSPNDPARPPQPAPIAAADRAVKPPLAGKPVDQLVLSGSFRARLPGDLAKVTELRLRLDATVTVSEEVAGSKGLVYDFHAGPHSTLREGVVTIDRCRLALGPDLLDQGACAEAGWAGIIRSLGGMPPIRTIRISPGRPKLRAAATSFATDPYAMLHILQEGASPASGIEYLMLKGLASDVKLDLLLLDAKGGTMSPFTLRSGSPLRLDRAKDLLEPAPATLEPWALDAMRRACLQAPALCM